MALVTKAYKGSRDFYPEEMRLRSEVFARWRQVAESFAFEEYDGPFLEERALYEAKSGQELVSKQLYDFVDKGGRSVAIRPEMTPTFARMVAGKLGELPRPIRWYSIPNLWRYEKPQRGRLREHFQFNADIMGGEPFLADLEMLQLANSLLKNFDLNNEVEIRVNHRGLWQEILASVWGFGSSEQDEETKLKITKLIDASDKMDASVLIAKLSQLNLTSFQLEKISSFISEPISLEIVEDWCENSESENLKQSFQYLKELMAHFSNTSSVKFDPKIMRGLDYYTGIIFVI